MELALLAARLLLAAVFLLAGATKFVDPVGTRKALRDFGVPSALAPPGLLLLPMLELAVAATLISTSLAWYGACGALALLIVFLIAAGIALLGGRRPDCHCFGQLHSAPVGWPLLLRNTVLAACAGWIISRGQFHSGTSLWAWLGSLDSHERRVAIVALCVLAFGFFYVLDRARPRHESIESHASATIDHREPPAPAPARMRPPAAEKPIPLGLGLPIGTPAPEFELPAITGEIRTLASLRTGGRDVILVFTSPFCESCVALTPKLVRAMREIEGLPSVVLISCGTAQANRAKLQGFEASQVLLQRNFEVAEAYDSSTTPTAVLVSADGLIRSELAMGGQAIEQLFRALPQYRSCP
ncbi:MAG: MauE/DoxX family redox-associated membrane protein [Bryobacteraceae bacterium]